MNSELRKRYAAKASSLARYWSTVSRLSRAGINSTRETMEARASQQRRFRPVRPKR